MADDPPLRPDEEARLLAPLTEREREVVRLRFGLDRGDPRTLEEVGDLLGLTRDAVRAIESAAMTRLEDPQTG